MNEIPHIFPAFDKACVALVMGTSGEYAPYLYVALTSILQNTSTSWNYDIIVLISGVAEQDQRLIMKLSENRKNVSIRFVNVEPIIGPFKLYVRDWFHPIIYARMLIPDLMRDYNRVIYLDSDVIVKQDIAELYNADLHGKIMGGVRDTAHVALYTIPGSDVKYDLDQRLKLKFPYEYINTGVLLFDIPAFRTVYTSEYLLKYSASNTWEWQDQDVFMTLCEGKIHILPSEWNVLVHGPIRDDKELMEQSAPEEMLNEYLSARQKPKIIHYVANSFLLVSPLPDQFEHYWDIARNTPYYEEILFRVFTKNYLRTTLQSVWDNLNRVEEKIDQNIIPGNRQVKVKSSLKDKLKSFFKKLFPRDTKRGWYCRLIYKKLKKR